LSITLQKLMDAAVHQKDLGSPTGETILGKTVCYWAYLWKLLV